MSPPSYTLYHSPRVGSTFTLALLRLLSLPHTIKLVQFTPDDAGGARFANEESRDAYMEMRSRNPLGQFPTLVVRDGEGKETAMTEMAAIALYLQHVHASRSSELSAWSLGVLTDEQKAAFFRLMVFIPVNVQSCNSIIRHPGDFVSVPEGSAVSAKEVNNWVRSKNVHNHESAYRTLESIVAVTAGDSPYVLGTTHPTFVDVYVTLMAHYSPKPRYEWLKENCPRLYRCAVETMKEERVREVFLEQKFENCLVEEEA